MGSILKRKLLRISIMAITLLLLALSFTSCSVEEGKINSVETSADSETYSEKNVFTKTDSPIDYKYNNLTIKKARISMDVPTSWTVKTCSSSCISFTVPAKDKYFPGCTFYLCFKHSINAATDEYSDFENNDKPTFYAKYFKDRISGLSYNVAGKSVCIDYYDNIDSETNDPSFCKDTNRLSTQIIDSPAFQNKSTKDHLLNSNYSYAITYFKWDNIPCMFTCVVPNDALSKGTAMMEHLVSSITYTPAKLNDLKTVKYEDISFKVPSNFKETEEGNVYKVAVDTVSSTAGLAVGIFLIDTSESGSFTTNTLTSYGDKIVKQLAPDSMPGTYTIHVSGIKGEVPDYAKNVSEGYYGIAQFQRQDNDYITATSVFGQTSTMYVDFFKYSVGDKEYILATMYDATSSELGVQLDKTVLGSLKL